MGRHKVSQWDSTPYHNFRYISSHNILMSHLLCAIFTFGGHRRKGYQGNSFCCSFDLLNYENVKLVIIILFVDFFADALIATGLVKLGYDYVNIDDCWSERTRNSEGKIVPDPNAFPSGMKALADYIHSKGLKIGIYSDAGFFIRDIKISSLRKAVPRRSHKERCQPQSRRKFWLLEKHKDYVECASLPPKGTGLAVLQVHGLVVNRIQKSPTLLRLKYTWATDGIWILNKLTSIRNDYLGEEQTKYVSTTMIVKPGTVVDLLVMDRKVDHPHQIDWNKKGCEARDLVNSLAESFYSFTKMMPSCFLNGKSGSDGSEPEDTCEAWLEKMDYVPYSSDSLKDTVFIYIYINM